MCYLLKQKKKEKLYLRQEINNKERVLYELFRVNIKFMVSCNLFL